jgi:hypothetical protein
MALGLQDAGPNRIAQHAEGRHAEALDVLALHEALQELEAIRSCGGNSRVFQVLTMLVLLAATK